MSVITGREDEIELLEASFKNLKSEFVAVWPQACGQNFFNQGSFS